MLGPTRSWLSRIARYRCKRELYRPSYTPETACRVLVAPSGTVVDVTKRPWDASARDYTRRLPAALSDELGGLSTSLGLSASPLLIRWTESVVVMEWKGMSTSIAP